MFRLRGVKLYPLSIRGRKFQVSSSMTRYPRTNDPELERPPKRKKFNLEFVSKIVLFRFPWKPQNRIFVNFISLKFLVESRIFHLKHFFVALVGYYRKQKKFWKISFSWWLTISSGKTLEQRSVGGGVRTLALLSNHSKEFKVGCCKRCPWYCNSKGCIKRHQTPPKQHPINGVFCSAEQAEQGQPTAASNHSPEFKVTNSPKVDQNVPQFTEGQEGRFSEKPFKFLLWSSGKILEQYLKISNVVQYHCVI